MVTSALLGVMVLIAALGLSVPANPYSFTVLVTVSPKAAARLGALAETITISASYFGDPNPSAMKHTDQVGQIDLGRRQIQIPGAGGQAVIDGASVKRERLAWLAPTGPQVNVNVFSSRRSGPDNLLDCNFFQDTVTVARHQTVKLACKLIGEH